MTVEQTTISRESARLKLQLLVERLSEITGMHCTLGYLGNCEGTPGTQAFKDDRTWYVFFPHPGRVGRARDRFGGVRTSALASLIPAIQGYVAIATAIQNHRNFA